RTRSPTTATATATATTARRLSRASARTSCSWRPASATRCCRSSTSKPPSSPSPWTTPSAGSTATSRRSRRCGGGFRSTACGIEAVGAAPGGTAPTGIADPTGIAEGARSGDGRELGLALLALHLGPELGLDPVVRPLDPLFEADLRLPAEHLAELRVVRVPAAHAHRPVDVDALDLDPGGVGGDLSELVDRHHP